MLDDAFDDARPRLPTVWQRALAQERPRQQRSATGQVPGLWPHLPFGTEENAHGKAFKTQVVAAYQDRMSLRGITRTFGVCYQTVMA